MDLGSPLCSITIAFSHERLDRARATYPQITRNTHSPYTNTWRFTSEKKFLTVILSPMTQRFEIFDNKKITILAKFWYELSNDMFNHFKSLSLFFFFLCFRDYKSPIILFEKCFYGSVFRYFGITLRFLMQIDEIFFSKFSLFITKLFSGILTEIKTELQNLKFR